MEEASKREELPRSEASSKTESKWKKQKKTSGSRGSDDSVIDTSALLKKKRERDL